MPVCNEYRDKLLVYHHTVDQIPDPGFFKMHCHERYEILVVLSGKGFFCAEGRKYPLGKGRIYISRPGETHGIQISADEPYERVAYHFSPELLSGKPRFLTDPFDKRAVGCNNEYSVKLVGQSAHMLTTIPDNVKDSLLQTYLLARLATFLCDFSQMKAEFSPSAPAVLPSDKLGAAIDYINVHVCDPLTLPELARAAGLSSSQLCRLFKSRLGTTVHEYILGKKAVAARQMLIDGVEPAEVAKKCGFGSYTAFYRTYYDKFGVSPTGVSIKKKNGGQDE